MDIRWTPLLDHLRPIFLSPILILNIALVIHEIALGSRIRKLGVFTLGLLSTGFSIGLTPSTNPAWSYGWGLLNAWAALVWVPLWLWCLDSRSSSTLAYCRNSASSETWVVRKHPPTVSLERAGWILDLVTDFRGILWSHGLRKDSPWHAVRAQYSGVGTHPLKQDKSRLALPALSNDYKSFTRDVLLRLLSLCAEWELVGILSEGYLHSLRNASVQSTQFSSYFRYATFMTTRATVTASFTYCLITSIHNVVTLAQMCLFLLGTKSLPPSWMFPQIFGHRFNTNLAKFWTQTWHDIFHFSLTTLSQQVKLNTAPKIVNNLLQAFCGFTLSGLFHAAASYAVDKNVPSALAAMCIFAMQPVAIIAQLLASKGLKAAGCPAFATKAASAAFGFGWLVTTVNLLADTSAFERVLCSFARK